eukprot:6826566-Pyramimonas_sp.AAC.2
MDWIHRVLDPRRVRPGHSVDRGKAFVRTYCCGPQSRIGDPKNFVDNSCKVIRYTEKEDMRTNEGL